RRTAPPQVLAPAARRYSSPSGPGQRRLAAQLPGQAMKQAVELSVASLASFGQRLGQQLPAGRHDPLGLFPASGGELAGAVLADDQLLPAELLEHFRYP